MATRASFYRAQKRHSQRSGGQVKPKLLPVGSDILWLGEWLQQAQGTSSFGVNSILALSLGATPEERMTKLRTAARRGVLSMSAHRENGVFIEYRWELAPAGVLSAR